MPLAWRHTWPGENRKDYTATDPERPRLFARIYRTTSHTTDAPWFWTVADNDRRLAGGQAETPKAAKAEVDDVYRLLCEGHRFTR